MKIIKKNKINFVLSIPTVDNEKNILYELSEKEYNFLKENFSENEEITIFSKSDQNKILYKFKLSFLNDMLNN
jgi:tRNA G26 N,N-dimethylase Trm1